MIFGRRLNMVVKCCRKTDILIVTENYGINIERNGFNMTINSSNELHTTDLSRVMSFRQKLNIYI